MTRLRCLLPFLSLALLTGCAGQLRDYMGHRAAIVRPQLIRYGFSLPEIACVGDRLGHSLHPRQLRFLVRATSHIQQPYYNPERFSPRDFQWAASGVQDPAMQTEIAHAFEACHVELAPQIAAAAPAVPAAPATPGAAVPGTLPPPSGGPALPATARTPVWLNLGAAPSGQSIAVDGASLEQEGDARVAWFRMIDPPPTGTSLHAYRLRIDCRTRIIRPLAHRLYDAAGAIVEERDYSDEEELPSPVEGGTVTEIAFLSLCT